METQLLSWSGTKEAQQYSQSEIEIVIMWILATGIINMGSLKESLESGQLTAFYDNIHIYHKEIYILLPSSFYWRVSHLCALYH